MVIEFLMAAMYLRGDEKQAEEREKLGHGANSAAVYARQIRRDGAYKLQTNASRVCRRVGVDEQQQQVSGKHTHMSGK